MILMIMHISLYKFFGSMSGFNVANGHDYGSLGDLKVILKTMTCPMPTAAFKNKNIRSKVTRADMRQGCDVI